jgi:hypothetical protein
MCHIVVGTSAFFSPTGVTDVPMIPKEHQRISYVPLGFG